jgi:(p)ppGpp synthase/HD superfamily hydrolase
MPAPVDEPRMLERAMAVAAAAHEGQTDKNGRPKLDHCRRVAARVEGCRAKAVAWLHDVVEKSGDWSTHRLAAEGFDAEIVSAVDAMTRRRGEDYFDFARRAASHPLARWVKRADLEDNSQQSVAAGQDASRYEVALALLKREGLLP